MRDIDATIKARALSKHQTVHENNEHSMEIIVSRPRTAIVHQRYWQESIVTAGATAVCTSVAIKRTGRWGETVYVAYVDSTGLLTVKSAPLRFPIREMSWTTVTTIPGCAACALEFDGSFIHGQKDTVEYITDYLPWLFYTTSTGQLMAGVLGGSYESLVGANVTAIDAVRGVASKYKDIDQGLLVFYVIAGSLYYRDLIDGVWGDQTSVSIAPADIVSVRAERTFDYRIVLQVIDTSGALHEIFTKMESSGWNGTEYLQVSNMTLAMAIIPIVKSSHEMPDEKLVVSNMDLEISRYSIHSPEIRWAFNVPIEIDDPYGAYGAYGAYDDYGYLVVFEFNQKLANAADYPELFILTDDNAVEWIGQEAYSDGMQVYVLFNNFNNAVNPITAKVIESGLTNGYADVTESSVLFNATGLVPFATEPPVPVAIWNDGAQTILIQFDKAIASIASQSGFTVSGYEPAYSPEGSLNAVEYTVDSIEPVADTKKIQINLTYAGRMKYPQGDVNIDFAGSLIDGSGSYVDPFTMSFTPVIEEPFFNPHAPEQLEASSMPLTFEVKKVTKSTTDQEAGILEVTEMSLVFALIHIDDIET